MDRNLPTVGRLTIPPDSGGLFEALSQIGYTLPEAIADVIDNSIDGGAKRVLVRFLRRADTLVGLLIADDGKGMRPGQLAQAMQFGARTPRGPEALGRFGVGLKLASFSQSRSVTVVTRSRAAVEAMRWTDRGVADRWTCEIVDSRAAAASLNTQRAILSGRDTGTLVVWDDLPKFSAAPGRAEVLLPALIKDIADHVGLHLHRYIGKGKLRVAIDVYDEVRAEEGPPREIEALDPFGYSKSGHAQYPRDFKISLPNLGLLRLRAHIWPPKSQSPNYRLGGGKVAVRQGFYFYRNDRLIQAGGWSGWRSDGETHTSLARVEVDLGARFDEMLSAQKSKIVVPLGFLAALDEARTGDHTLSEYIGDAQQIYRRKLREGARSDPTPAGMPASVRAEAQRAGAVRAPRVRIDWEDLGPDDLFRVESDPPTLVLNSKLKARGKAVGFRLDAAATKLALVLLVGEAFTRKRSSSKMTGQHANWSRLLAKALTGS